MSNEKLLIKEALEYLESQPPETWTTGKYRDGKGRFCAVGHLREGFSAKKANIIYDAITVNASRYNVSFGNKNNLIQVNDSARRDHKNPKARVVAFVKKVLDKMP